jgi:transcriptional regulator with XRE-family HTH domain
MKFLELHERLRLETWRRIDQGVLSSSLLARRTGLAQAHISNFLHRRRRLSLHALDRVLGAQALSVEELLPATEFDSLPAARSAPESMDAVPIVSQAVAMNAPAISRKAVTDTLQLPSGWLASFPARRAVSRRHWERFVGVRVTGLQALPMDPLLRVGSIAILDRHYNSLAAWKPPRPNLYAVRAGAQLLFRHAVFESNRLVLRPRALEQPLDVIELSPHESPSDLLVGRVCLCLSEL